jgi:hypothetical protein
MNMDISLSYREGQLLSSSISLSKRPALHKYNVHCPTIQIRAPDYAFPLLMSLIVIAQAESAPQSGDSVSRAFTKREFHH